MPLIASILLTVAITVMLKDELATIRSHKRLQ